MNPLHYPDQPRCEKLYDLHFPKTEKVYIQKALLSDECRICTRWDYSQYEDEAYWKLPCPSVMEMLDVIPTKISLDNQHCSLSTYAAVWRKAPFYVGYMWEKGKFMTQPQFNDTLPNALADLIFWLVENKYLKF